RRGPGRELPGGARRGIDDDGRGGRLGVRPGRTGAGLGAEGGRPGRPGAGPGRPGPRPPGPLRADSATHGPLAPGPLGGRDAPRAARPGRTRGDADGRMELFHECRVLRALSGAYLTRYLTPNITGNRIPRQIIARRKTQHSALSTQHSALSTAQGW